MASEDIDADVIVVGAGAAGCVIARRLHDAGASVLLLEAGGVNDDERIADATRSYELPNSPYDWAYRTVPQRHLRGRVLEWPRGRVTGGSSSINALVWIRGCAEDYDAWAYPGNPGWSFADLLPIFKRIEDFDRGASELRGTGGPIHVISEYERGAVHEAVIDGMQELGIPFNDDHNAGDQIGTGWCQFNVRDGRRISAASAYVEPILASPRLELVNSVLVTRLLFDQSRCTGVEWEADGHVYRAHAAEEVIVGGGVIGSPQLLLLSGVGPAADLAELGLNVVADLPGVGNNLHDHVHVPIVYATDRPVEPPVGVPMYQTNTFIKTDPRLFTSDIQVPSMGTLGDYPGLKNDCEHGFLIAPTGLRTASRGRLRLAGADPRVQPLIDPATFDAPGDLAPIVAAIQLLRGLDGTRALEEWGAREIHPGPTIAEEAELEDYARRVTLTAAHPVGTCKMGVDADSVVDPKLRVYGVERLRVADASIMPTVVSGNTHIASLAIGERAAEILIGAERPAMRA